MRTAVLLVVVIIVVLTLIWLAVFGSVGALLAPRQARSSVRGFVIGSLFGPIGWLWLAFRPVPSGSVEPRAELDVGSSWHQGGDGIDDDNLPIN